MNNRVEQRKRNGEHPINGNRIQDEDIVQSYQKQYVLNGLFLCNNIAYNDVQRNLSTFLMANNVSDNSYMWSKFEGQNIKVGATYSAYEYAGEN